MADQTENHDDRAIMQARNTLERLTLRLRQQLQSLGDSKGRKYKIDNPWRYVDSSEIDKYTDAIYHYYGLGDYVDLRQLRRGACLAQNPTMFRVDEGNKLASVEAIALEDEKDPKLWQQGHELKVIVLTCCVAALVQGWSQAGMGGANLQWPAEFGVENRQWIIGGVNAITYFAAAIVGSWLSDPLNELFAGRRGALFVSALFTFAASIGSAFVESWQALLGCRLILGIGYGAKASVVPIYESEIAPAEIRGRILVSWQTFTAVGIFLGSAANLVFHGPVAGQNNSWRVVGWRLQLAICAVPAICLLLLTYCCSESPRWLAKKGHYGKAYEVLCRLRPTELQAARDLISIYGQLQAERALLARIAIHDIPNGNTDPERLQQTQTLDVSNDRTRDYPIRVKQLFSVPRVRRASLAACIVMASQQLSGINIFAFLAGTLFQGAGFTNMKSLWLTFGFATSNAVFSPLAFPLIDGQSASADESSILGRAPRGRRFLLLASLIAMIPLLIATAFAFDIDKAEHQTAHIAVVELFLILYTAAYSPGAGVVPFAYSSEVFPLGNREAGMSLACSVNFILGGVLVLTVPQLVTSWGPTRTLGLFAGLDTLAAILVWLFVPGTAEVISLEEFNDIFRVPTLGNHGHVAYQLSRDVVRYNALRFVPGTVVEEPEPLYMFYDEQEQQPEVRATQHANASPTNRYA